jgi:hypothetical protein
MPPGASPPSRSEPRAQRRRQLARGLRLATGRTAPLATCRRLCSPHAAASMLAASGRDRATRLRPAPWLAQQERRTAQGLRGRITEHYPTMLRLHWQVVDALQQTLEELDAIVGSR